MNKLALLLVGVSILQRGTITVGQFQEDAGNEVSQVSGRQDNAFDGRGDGIFTANQQIANEREMNNIFFEGDIDRIGGNSASELHSKFTFTKVKSVKMGKKYRKKLLKHILGEKEDRVDPVVESCGAMKYQCDTKAIYRTANGSCNNLLHPDWGQSFIPMRRFLPPEYDDGIFKPRTKGRNGLALVSPRQVSTNVHTTDDETTLESGITHMAMQFAQFLDHDITHTPIERGAEGASIICCPEDIPIQVYGAFGFGLRNITTRHECFPIDIPPGDRRFTGSCMNFVRSVQISNADCKDFPAEQSNQITAYVDASQIYGSSEEEQHELRGTDGGLLKISGGGQNLLPENSHPTCVTSSSPNYCFRAGDERVDEHMALASMHTIWMREHNRIAKKLAEINPHWDDERLFQETRKIVGAMMQHIAYTEFLPLVLSPEYISNHQLEASKGYSSHYDFNVDASIRNAFATAAFRFGHSMIRSQFSHCDRNLNHDEELRLTDSFGNTSIILSSGGAAVNSLTRGLVTDMAQSVDRHITQQITDFLFHDSEGNSFDLMALNIQRGRDHGIPGYNAWRKWCGLPAATHFGTGLGGLVDHTEDTADTLQTLYRHPDDIDLFPGGLSERPVSRGLLGKTFSCILARQFEKIKVGDRFWYETGQKPVRFTKNQLRELRQVRLSRIICDNTDTISIQPSVFRMADKGGNQLRDCADSSIASINLNQWEEQDMENMEQWSKWSSCSQGKRTRKRKCKGNGRKCKGLDVDVEPCNCPWSEYGNYGRCVKGCQFRIRTCPCKSCRGGDDLDFRFCSKKNKLKKKRNCKKIYRSISEWYFAGP